MTTKPRCIILEQDVENAMFISSDIYVRIQKIQKGCQENKTTKRKYAKSEENGLIFEFYGKLEYNSYNTHP